MTDELSYEDFKGQLSMIIPSSRRDWEDANLKAPLLDKWNRWVKSDRTKMESPSKLLDDIAYYHRAAAKAGASDAFISDRMKKFLRKPRGGTPPHIPRAIVPAIRALLEGRVSTWRGWTISGAKSPPTLNHMWAFYLACKELAENEHSVKDTRKRLLVPPRDRSEIARAFVDKKKVDESLVERVQRYARGAPLSLKLSEEFAREIAVRAECQLISAVENITSGYVCLAAKFEGRLTSEQIENFLATWAQHSIFRDSIEWNRDFVRASGGESAPSNGVPTSTSI